MQYIYRFKKNHYNQEGINMFTNETLISDVIDWQRDFFLKNSCAYANILIANANTIKLIRKNRRKNKAVSSSKQVLPEFIESPALPDGFVVLKDHHSNLEEVEAQ